MPIRDNEYWEKRFSKMHTRIFDEMDDKEKELVKIFQNASKGVEKTVNNYYIEYGQIRKTPKFETLEDGTRLVVGESSKLTLPNDFHKSNRFSVLQNELATILQGMGDEELAYFNQVLTTTTKKGYYNTIYEIHKGLRIGTSFQLLDSNVIRELIENPVNGLSFSNRIWENTDRLAKQLNEELRAGIIQGISNDDMSDNINKKFKTKEYVGKRLIRTEITNTLNQSTLRGYKASGIVDKYEYRATLDNRTTEVCSTLDGKVIDIDEAVTGVNLPPLHPNCRSTTVALFPDTMEQVQTRLARNNETGETFVVSGDITFNEYAKKYIGEEI